MSCEHRHEAAAYVLGALDPADRTRFETHHRRCAVCTEEVRGLAGVPGVLAHVSPQEFIHESRPQPDMVANLFGLVRADRRKRRIRAVIIAAAVVVLVAFGAVTAVDMMRPPPERQPLEPVAVGVEFESVDGLDFIWGEAELVVFPEGTQIKVDCSYDIGDNYGVRPYRLVVTHLEGETEVAGSWQTHDGISQQVTMFTRWAPEEIATMEIQDLEGTTVLRWDRD